MKWNGIFCLILLLLMGYTQLIAQDDKLNNFLNAMVSRSVDKSKEIIINTSFNLENEYTINTFSDPKGEYFASDIPSIQGFRARVWCNVSDAEGMQVLDTFLVVMYYDHVNASWKVFDFRKNADACYEAAVSQEDVDQGKFYTDKEFVYRNLGYWQMMCGNISLAEKAYKLAEQEAESKGSNEFVQADLEAIRRIK